MPAAALLTAIFQTSLEAFVPVDVAATADYFRQRLRHIGFKVEDKFS